MTAGTSYSNTGLTASTVYTYTVSAYDAAGNNSAQSGSVSAMTQGTSSGSTPYSGTPTPIPGTIQFENYDLGGEGVAYHDADAANLGGAYRTTEGVDIQTTGDTGGGYNVGWTLAGEWMNYTVNVQTAGAYTMTARVASGGQGGTFHLTVDGAALAGSTLTVPNTGAWQTYTNLTASVTLPQGQHILRFVEDTNGTTGWIGNLNWLSFALAPDTTPPSTPTNLTASAISSSQINLAWTAATDNVGVTGYKVFRNGTQVGTTATTNYSDTGLAASTSYTYTVSAYDAAGNVSGQSASATAMTPPPSPSSVTISNFSVSAVTATSATITFTTNVPATSQVFYGPNGTFSQSDAMTATPSTTHTHVLTNLTAGTSYSYKISALFYGGGFATQ